MNTRLFALLAGAMAIALLAVGCGSSDDSTTDSTTDSGSVATSSLSKAEFIEQADAICSKANDSISEEAEAYAEDNGISTDKEPSDEEKEEIVVEVIVPAIETQVDEIEELGAPSGDEETITAIVEGIRTASSETADDPSLAFGSPTPFEDVNKEAQDYGLEVCGED